MRDAMASREVSPSWWDDLEIASVIFHWIWFDLLFYFGFPIAFKEGFFVGIETHVQLLPRINCHWKYLCIIPAVLLYT